ncbi:MAG: SDR family NAD(P)-dependent oxidoreductase [Actinobacteria bacterium]|nr:SDR family NAD(P)-dependent oxidoreductase [Actinomycetota bacterium]
MSGRVVAVVGASGAIGGLVTRSLLERGDAVLGTGRSAASLEATGRDAPPGRWWACPLDLRNPNAGDRLVEVVRSGPGHLDAVVLAAGVVAFGDLESTPDDVIEELFVTNVLGPLWLLRRLIPMLSERQGTVVNISAVVAEQPLPGMAAYAASKAALTAADLALRRELRRRRIRVVDVRPPHTETGLAGRAIHGEPPRLPVGLDPAVVAGRIVAALEDPAVEEIPSTQFTSDD